MARKIRDYTDKFKQEAVKCALQNPRLSNAAIGVPAITFYGRITTVKDK